MRRLLFPLALLAPALLWAGGCRDLDLPPGCEDILVSRSDEPNCVSGDRCDQVQANETYVARWILFIDEYFQDANGDDVAYSSEQMAKRRNCVADYLDNRGITLIDRGSDSTPYVTAEGIAANFDAILEFEPVRGYDLLCSGEVCENCAELDQSGCEADAFCYPVSGRAHDEAQACLQDPAFAFCQSGDLGCGAAETWAQEPGGACWLFVSTCTPPDWEDSPEACTALDQAELPACP